MTSPQEHSPSAADAARFVVIARGTAKYKGPENFDLSVRRGVELDAYASVLGPDEGELRKHCDEGVVRLWGATPSTRNDPRLEAIRERRAGDHVLFYGERTFVARARILHRFDNAALARRVWGSPGGGLTWEHIVVLGDVEEFEPAVPSADILVPLGRDPVVRSMFRCSAEESTFVREHLGDARVRPVGAAASGGAPPALTASALLDHLSGLQINRAAGQPSPHKVLALLWSMGRAERDPADRMAPWETFRVGVGALLRDFGGSARRTPVYPFWHLRTSGIWEIEGVDLHGDPPTAGRLGASPARAGLGAEAVELLGDSFVRAKAIAVLLGHLPGLDRPALLRDVGLPGYATASGTSPDEESDPAGLGEPQDERSEGRGREPGAAAGPAKRRPVTRDESTRRRRVRNWVTELYDDACQVCSKRLRTLTGTSSQGAHIRGLGHPHLGPDETSNMLCLCADHHFEFDQLGIYIDRHGVVRDSKTDVEEFRLTVHDRHGIDPEHIRYHRALCGKDISSAGLAEG